MTIGSGCWPAPGSVPRGEGDSDVATLLQCAGGVTRGSTMKARKIYGIGCLTWLILAATEARALDILLTNDDGFESAQIRALYAMLEDRGHSVVISAPTQNNSGTGGAMGFLHPVGPLTRATRGGTVAAGAPGVGTDPADPDIHYVDGSPVMSLLYGLDVIAFGKWGRQPDLVVSGPNEGNNQGLINPSSGTFNNALYAINRGIPAIAVSSGETAQKNGLPGDKEAIEFRIAGLVVDLIDRIERNRGGARSKGALLPPGTGLNVNVPKFDPAHGCTPSEYRLPVLERPRSSSRSSSRSSRTAPQPSASGQVFRCRASHSCSRAARRQTGFPCRATPIRIPRPMPIARASSRSPLSKGCRKSRRPTPGRCVRCSGACRRSDECHPARRHDPPPSAMIRASRQADSAASERTNPPPKSR